MNNHLEIKNLNININSNTVVSDINISIKPSQIVALVGESGSGKSLIASSILKLLPNNASFDIDGKIIFDDKNILTLNQKELLSLRGNKISIIFQEPMSALNPLHKVFDQISEIIEVHNFIDKKNLKNK